MTGMFQAEARSGDTASVRSTRSVISDTPATASEPAVTLNFAGALLRKSSNVESQPPCSRLGFSLFCARRGKGLHREFSEQ